MSKQFWGLIAVIVLIFGGIIVFGGDKAGDNSGKNSAKQLTQHVKGEGSSGVTLVEYGDYQCPYCQQYEPTLRAVQLRYSREIKFQFRNFPIVSSHQNAFAAARAAEAAALQDKFWEMHDLLYESASWQQWTRSQAPTALFNQYAGQLGLDVAKFKTDFASTKVNDLINADIAEGTRLGVKGTPSFFVDGKKVEIANTMSAFDKVIKEAIAKKEAKAAGSDSASQNQTD